jgi:PAS domain S-box-containing protein
MTGRVAGKRRSTRVRRATISPWAVPGGIAEAIPVPILVFDGAGQFVSGNKELFEFLGTDMAGVAGSGWLSHVDAEDRRMVGEIVAAAAAARQPFHLTCRIRAHQNALRTCELHSRVWMTGKRLSGYVSTMLDVTARDAAARRARVNAHSLRGLSDHTPDMFFVVDRAGRIVHWNPAAAQFAGRREDQVVGELLTSLVRSPEIDAALRDVRSTEKPRKLRGVSWPGRTLSLDCTIFPAGEDCGVLMTPEGESTKTGTYEALCQCEEQLRRSEERYRAFTENTSEGIWRFDTHQPIPVNAPVAEQVRMMLAHVYLAECNDTLARFYGPSSPADLLHARLGTAIRLDPLELEGHLTRFVTAGYRLSDVEVSQHDAEGGIRYLQWSFAGIVERGCLLRVWGMIRDVTERREAERRLRLLAHTLTSTRDAISITDVNNAILFVNDAFVHTYGFSEEELIGQNIALVRSLNTPAIMDEQIRTSTLQGEWYGEVLNRRADGSEFPVELWTSVVHNDEGDPVALVGVARDITERKRTDESLRASLREKEVLLKEIHHRVKNNLQVISSLLSLQAEYLTDESMLRIMRESQGRVKSMALVHEKLYQSHNLAEIDFGDYVRVLVMQLFRSYGIPQDTVQMAVTADPVALGVDRAIPCGIIVNELVTNALKYAFPDRRKGKVEVELRSIPPGTIRLTIRDDGVGLPPDIEFHKADSLGLTLVHMLTDQVQGELTIPRTLVGAEFVLTFRK